MPLLGLLGKWDPRPLLRVTWRPLLAGGALVAVGLPTATVPLVGIPAAAVAFVVVMSVLRSWPVEFARALPDRLGRRLATVARSPSAEAARGTLTVSRADAVTACSTWLQQRYGGTVVPHTRDGDVLDPTATARQGGAMRGALGLEDAFVVTFLGSARPGKGTVAGRCGAGPSG